MTNHYTPDEEQVRAAYVEMEHFKSRGMSDREADSAEFDRFIAKVKADAVREAEAVLAADALCMDWERRVEAYKKGYSDGRNERDCDPGAALDDAR